MVLADMLFAEGLRVVHGLGYDWTARKIWPLLREASAHMGQQLLTRADHPAPSSSDSEGSDGSYGGWALNLPFLRALLSANMLFVLLGDEKEWRELIGASEAAEAAFAVYKRKFAPFFVADYEWTDRNGACVRTPLPPHPLYAPLPAAAVQPLTWGSRLALRHGGPLSRGCATRSAFRASTSRA